MPSTLPGYPIYTKLRPRKVNQHIGFPFHFAQPEWKKFLTSVWLHILHQGQNPKPTDTSFVQLCNSFHQIKHPQKQWQQHNFPEQVLGPQEYYLFHQFSRKDIFRPALVHLPFDIQQGQFQNRYFQTTHLLFLQPISRSLHLIADQQESGRWLKSFQPDSSVRHQLQKLQHISNGLRYNFSFQITYQHRPPTLHNFSNPPVAGL